MDRQRRTGQLILVAALALATACLAPGSARPERPADLLVASVPAPSGKPIAVALGGGDAAWFGWTEGTNGTGALRAAHREGDGWDAPVTLATGAVLALPGAVPAIAGLREGGVIAAYFARGEKNRDLDLWSVVNGEAPKVLEREIGTHHEARVTLVERVDGKMSALWLREVVGPLDRQRDTGVVFASRENGSFGARRPLDARVCDRGALGAAPSAAGLVFAWRSLSSWREMDVVAWVLDDGHWARSAGLVADGWRAGLCPTEGPSLAGNGRHAFLAWYTGSHGDRVKVATSIDSGRTFGGTVRVDGGHPKGGVAIAAFDARDSVVAWYEDDAMMVRKVDIDGHKGVVVRAGGASGLSATPVFARDGDGLLLAWLDATGLKLARITRTPK